MIRRSFSTVLALAVLGTTAARADDGPLDLRVGVMSQIPYGFFTESGGTQGYLYDLSHALVDEAGLSGRVSVLPHKRLHKELGFGGQDCAFFADTGFVKRTYRLIEPIGRSIRAGILPRAGVVLDRYEDLAGLRIGVPRGVFLDKRFDGDETLNKIETKDYQQNVRMLQRRRLDAIAGAIGSQIVNARLLGLPTGIFGEPLVMGSHALWLTCRREGLDEVLVERLRGAMRRLREDGTVERIVDGYLGPAKPR